MTALCLAWAACGHGQTTIHVATTGNDETGDGMAGKPYLTISNGVAHAGAGDTVQVATGTYTVVANIYITNTITVLGMNAPTGVVITTMYPDPASSSRCVQINSAGAVFAGMTVEKGYPPLNDLSGRGGGIYLAAGLVSNCVIRDCHLGVANGGGIYMTGADAVVADCTVVSNSVEYSGVGVGGGVYMSTDSTMLRTTVITNGNTGGYGAGVCVYGSRTRLEDCRILDNWGTAADYGYGAGLYLRGTNIVVNGCVISNNYTPSSGAGIITFYTNTAVTISGCTITHNRAGFYGGGIVSWGNALVSNCWITCNQAYQGGGLANHSGSAYIGLMTVTHSRVIANTNTSTVSNGGGGMNFKNHCGLVEYCDIASNVTALYGAGIYVYNPAPAAGMTVRHCRIAENASARMGGGLYCSGGPVLVEHCEIVSNYVTAGNYQGAGMFLTNAEITVQNCLVAGNRTTAWGGGIMAQAGTDTLIKINSCTIADNQSSNYGGGGLGVSTYLASEMVEVWNTVVSSNHVKAGQVELYIPTTTNSFYYSCGPGLTNAAQGNITNAPVFAGYTVGNYRLAAGSPGVNAGSNQAWMVDALDLDGRTRIDRFSRLTDMGCYEYLPSGMLFQLR